MTVKFGKESPHWKGGQIERQCLVCDKNFFVDKNVVDKGYGKFCSRSCTGKRSYGHKRAPRVPCICLVCKKKFFRYFSAIKKEPNRGKCCSHSCRAKYTQGRISGDKHYRWLDGKTKINALERSHMATRNWAREVKVRDDFTCQKCGARGGRLHSHHIKPWKSRPDLKHVLGNGITLCVPCHRKIHGWKSKEAK